MIKGRHGKADSHELNAMLGLADKQKLPAEGMPARVIQGVMVYVRPLDPQRGRRRKPHRVMAFCPKCGKEMSAGRLHQHMTVHR